MEIPNMFKTKIEIYDPNTNREKYDLNIDSTYLIRVTVIDFSGQPVHNAQVLLYIDDYLLTNKFTNSSGIIEYSTTFQRFGIHTISANISGVPNNAIQIDVNGWKLYNSKSATNGWYTNIYFNKTHAKCIINDPVNVSFTTTIENYVDILTDTWIRPNMPVVARNLQPGVGTWIIARDNNSQLQKMADSNRNAQIYMQFEWVHRGLPSVFTTYPTD